MGRSHRRSARTSATGSSAAINPSLRLKVPYDPLTDFLPVIQTTAIPLVVVGSPSFAPNNFAEVLALDDRGFRARFRGSPLLRAKRRGLLRSAAIVLGNRPHPPSFAAMAAAVADDDAVIRAAAAWALGRWIAANAMPAEARDVLASRRPIEPDATVQAEIEAGLGQHKPGVHDPSDWSALQSAVSSMSPDGSRPGASPA